MFYEYSKIGKYHELHRMENQDAILSGSKEDCSVIVLADGVSTCSQSKIGANIVCRALKKLLLDNAPAFLQADKAQSAAIILAHIRHALQRTAAVAGIPVEEYSSTLSAALYDRVSGKLFLFHLGDGLILSAGRGRYAVLAQPCDSRNGCVVTTTEGAEKRACVQILSAEDLDRVMICSDGAWRAMLAGNRINNRAAAALIEGDFPRLHGELERSYDDCSFLAMNLCQPARG